MSLQLIASLDEMTEEQKRALVTTVADGSFLEDFDARHLGMKRLRAMFDSPEHVPTREDVVSALNWAEGVRILMHVTLVMVSDNVKRLSQYVRSGACAYCDWMYTDESITWDGNREVTEDELAEVQARITAAIRAHVVVCPNHPMRALEGRLAEVAE